MKNHRLTSTVLLSLPLACGSPEAEEAAHQDALGPLVVLAPTPSEVVLSQRLFVEHLWQQNTDRDEDYLVDAAEAELAEKTKPFMKWSQIEPALLPGEPLTMFQVIPFDCVGLGCPYVPGSGSTPGHTQRVRVRFGFLWANDDGYQTGGFCALSGHPGDSQGLDLELVSVDGITWTISNLHVGNDAIFNWPGQEAVFRDQTHPVVFFAAGNHHQYLNRAFHTHDSPMSDHGCDEIVDGLGPAFFPDLTSLRPAPRGNNVGEADQHPPQFFVDELSPRFPGFHAWGAAMFLGADPVRDLWFDDPPAKFSGQYAQDYSVISGHVSLSNGADPRQVTMYYRRANATDRRWGTIALDAAGDFTVTMPVSWSFDALLFRPVSSDHDFLAGNYGGPSSSIPRVVLASPDSTPQLDFAGQARPQLAYAERAIARSAKWQTLRATAFLGEVPDTLSALTSAAVTSGASACTGLARRSDLAVQLFSLLALDDTLASSEANADLLPAIASYPASARIGGPVAGAQVELAILPGAGVIDPFAVAPIVVTTDGQGIARARLVAGTHPGALRIRARVITNPANPFFTPEATYRVTLQPDCERDDQAYGAIMAKLEALPIDVNPLPPSSGR